MYTYIFLNHSKNNVMIWNGNKKRRILACTFCWRSTTWARRTRWIAPERTSRSSVKETASRRDGAAILLDRSATRLFYTSFWLYSQQNVTFWHCSNEEWDRTSSLPGRKCGCPSTTTRTCWPSIRTIRCNSRPDPPLTWRSFLPVIRPKSKVEEHCVHSVKVRHHLNNLNRFLL